MQALGGNEIRLTDAFGEDHPHERHTITVAGALTADDELAAAIEACERQLDIIRESGDALLVIIDYILDFSKIEAGRLDLDPLAFRLDEVVHAVPPVVLGFRDRAGRVEAGSQITPRDA